MGLVSRLFRKIIQLIEFALFFTWELILANVRVARDVIAPRQHMRPGVIAVPLDTRNANEITLLACLITLTPGTISMDVAEDRSVLYIHAMFIEDPDEFRQEIKQGFERRVMEVFRWA